MCSTPLKPVVFVVGTGNICQKRILLRESFAPDAVEAVVFLLPSQQNIVVFAKDEVGTNRKGILSQEKYALLAVVVAGRIQDSVLNCGDVIMLPRHCDE